MLRRLQPCTRLYTVLHCIHWVVLHKRCQLSNYYTEKCQFFAFILEKFTPDRKNLHGHRPWCPWQIWGMDLCWPIMTCSWLENRFWPLSSKKSTFCGTPKLTHLSNFTPTLTMSRNQTFTAGLDLTCSLFFWLNSGDVPVFYFPFSPSGSRVSPVWKFGRNWRHLRNLQVGAMQQVATK